MLQAADPPITTAANATKAIREVESPARTKRMGCGEVGFGPRRIFGGIHDACATDVSRTRNDVGRTTVFVISNRVRDGSVSLHAYALGSRHSRFGTDAKHGLHD